MANKKYIYRPADCTTDAQLIEKLTRALINVRTSTDNYQTHFGAAPRQLMQYHNKKADELLQQLFTKPQNT